MTSEERKEEARSENRLVANEWKEFARTTAYKKLMDYIEFQDYAAIQSAKGPVLTFDDESGSQVNFNPQNAATLLQRSVGYDIITTYIKGYVDFTTKS